MYRAYDIFILDNSLIIFHTRIILTPDLTTHATVLTPLHFVQSTDLLTTQDQPKSAAKAGSDR